GSISFTPAPGSRRVPALSSKRYGNGNEERVRLLDTLCDSGLVLQSASALQLRAVLSQHGLHLYLASRFPPRPLRPRGVGRVTTNLRALVPGSRVSLSERRGSQ